jgi:hypothetical protein
MGVPPFGAASGPDPMSDRPPGAARIGYPSSVPKTALTKPLKYKYFMSRRDRCSAATNRKIVGEMPKKVSF